MHLFAEDSLGSLIEAKKASKQQDYYCLECQGIVRRRSGIHRTPHFFHLEPPDSCRQQGKSLTHLQVQFHLQSLLPAGESRLEYAFPEVKRIADVAWLTQNIIFEIQCSPISPQEIHERQEDYLSQGFQVVWILHSQRYNQTKLSAAENFLQPFPHYYTSIDADGQGIIYDQFSIIQQGMRRNKGRIFKIDPCKPIYFTGENNLSAAHPRSQWPIYFEGDCLHQKLHGLAECAHFFENTNEKKPFLPKLPLLAKKAAFYLYRPYDLIFKMLLEKACK